MSRSTWRAHVTSVRKFNVAAPCHSNTTALISSHTMFAVAVHHAELVVVLHLLAARRRRRWLLSTRSRSSGWMNSMKGRDLAVSRPARQRQCARVGVQDAPGRRDQDALVDVFHHGAVLYFESASAGSACGVKCRE